MFNDNFRFGDFGRSEFIRGDTRLGLRNVNRDVCNINIECGGFDRCDFDGGNLPPIGLPPIGLPPIGEGSERPREVFCRRYPELCINGLPDPCVTAGICNAREFCEDFPEFSAMYSYLQPNPFLIIVDFKNNECELITFPQFESNKFVNRLWVESENSGNIITNGVWKNNTFTATIWNNESVTRQQLRFTFNEDRSELMFERRWDAHLPFQSIATAVRVK